MESFAHPVSERIRAFAIALPEIEEGTSCVNRAFKIRKKNFLFLGEKADRIKLMVKLTDTAASAAEDPRVTVGKGGWATIVFTPDDPPPLEVLEAWVQESFAALAPKRIVTAWREGR